jgi:hypothetical protein
MEMIDTTAIYSGNLISHEAYFRLSEYVNEHNFTYNEEENLAYRITQLCIAG